MADPPHRITLREARSPDINLQPIQIRYPSLDPNFELKIGTINLLPKYNGLPGEDPLKHFEDFQVACSTARRHGADEVAVMLLLDASSGGSLTKNKTATEAWEIIADLADSTQHSRARNPQPKALSEVSPSRDAILTKTLGEMTILLRQITQGQQIPQALLSSPPQPLRIVGPPRSCGICACNNHYTDEYPQLQEDTTLAVANPYPQRSNYNQHGENKNQGWRDNSNQRWNQSPQAQPYPNAQAYYHQPIQGQQPYQQSTNNHHNLNLKGGIIIHIVDLTLLKAIKALLLINLTGMTPFKLLCKSNGSFTRNKRHNWLPLPRLSLV
ncbi:hypothetical protein AHAS_Ahas12G0095600 [Arachis hypogaea]